SLL
ncbi:transcriptional regulatory family protein, partial [Chlamydia psittaci 08-2626_L3]